MEGSNRTLELVIKMSDYENLCSMAIESSNMEDADYYSQKSEEILNELEGEQNEE